MTLSDLHENDATELRARLRLLEAENARLQRAADEVAEANVHAALQLVALSDARASELEVKNGEIERALALAEQASELKSQFLANMSHELRTPISGILGMVDLLSDTDLDEQQRDLVATIASTADSFLELVHQLLDFTKAEAGALELEAIDFDLWDTCERVAELLQVSADQKGISFDFVLGRSVPRHSKGDPVRLRQVLLNLGSNAVKFTERGVVRFSVALDAVGDDQHIRFCFEDSGCGFAPEIGERLFEPFIQADVSTTRRFGGTGLGLSICKQLVLRMGGTITCESVVDLGSRFEARIPVARVADAAVVAPMQRGRVLLACLRPSTVESLQTQFEGMGFEVLGDPFLDVRWTTTVASLGADDWVVLEAAEDPSPALRYIREQNAAVQVIVVAGARSSTCRQLSAFDVRAVVLPPLRPTAIATIVNSKDAATARAGRPEEGAFSGLRVLVVDDAVINRRALSIQLERLGCAVDCAAGGKDALAIWRRGRHDIIFLDCQMPGLDGYAVAETIRRLEEARGAQRCAILALSADTSGGAEARCLAAGMDAFHQKPMKRDQLATCLDRWARR